MLDGRNSAYDKAAKQILSQKKLLAWILKHTVKEFESFSIKEIAESCIEHPLVATEHVNADDIGIDTGNKIRGSRNESDSVSEGTITFDILFHAIVPNTKERIALIINVEAQKNIDTPYPLIKRALYYVSRMISFQKETEFTGSDYGNIKKVYSIWLCMDSPTKQNSITGYQIMPYEIYHMQPEDERNYDLLSIIMVYLGAEKSQNRLIELLRLLFIDEASAAEKIQHLQQDYNIEFSNTQRKELNTMCNLSEGIFERGIEKGRIENVIDLIKMGLLTFDAIKKSGKYTPEELSIINARL